MKFSLLALVAISVLVLAGSAQVPSPVQIQILKAEDARRYDKALSDLLKSPNEPIRLRAALAAGRIGDEAAIPALANLMTGDGSIRVREMAAFALGEIESIKAADVILMVIGETAKAKLPGVPDADNRGRLVEAAGKIAAANAKDPKAKDLGAAIIYTLEAEHLKGSQQDNRIVRMALTAALRARPDKVDFTVAKFLASAEASVRADAANALARIRPRNSAELSRRELNDPLRGLLKSDKDPVVRANAARALSVAAEDAGVSATLIEAAVNDTDERVRVSSIRASAFTKSERNAQVLLDRADQLMAVYKASAFRLPNAQNELLEVFVALGRLLTNTRNQRAVNLLREFGKRDKGFSTEAYIARLRIAPGRGDEGKSELTHWKQYSTMAQIIGEFATLEPTNEEGKKMKAEAPDMLRPLAQAYAEADPVKDADTIKTGPDVLRAYAAFKTADLGAILRDALTNKDLFIRATAAELLADLPSSQENLDALNVAFDYAFQNDVHYDDAVLATLDALFKLDKRKSLSALAVAAGSPDQLVRKKALELLRDDAFKQVEMLPSALQYSKDKNLDQVRPFSGKGTKMGALLNTDIDYRRAAARKNGGVKAILNTEKGTFAIDLLPEDAPLTVDNFIKLANSGYYNGLEVHRVVPNFVMQDGDTRGDGNGGPGWSIRCELNMVPYDRGAVGMALSGKDTGGSQWFVTHSPQPHLDGGYTVFGRVNEVDMKVVDSIVRGDKIVSVKIVESSTQRSRRTRRK